MSLLKTKIATPTFALFALIGCGILTSLWMAT